MAVVRIYKPGKERIVGVFHFQLLHFFSKIFRSCRGGVEFSFSYKVFKVSNDSNYLNFDRSYRIFFIISNSNYLNNESR